MRAEPSAGAIAGQSRRARKSTRSSGRHVRPDRLASGTSSPRATRRTRTAATCGSRRQSSAASSRHAPRVGCFDARVVDGFIPPADVADGRVDGLAAVVAPRLLIADFGVAVTAAVHESHPSGVDRGQKSASRFSPSMSMRRFAIRRWPFSNPASRYSENDGVHSMKSTTVIPSA